MPWKVNTMFQERFQFVVRLRAGERMQDLCEEFSISRKTGYKFFRRYQEEGLLGLQDRSRRPKRLTRSIDAVMIELILECKQRRPTWGAPKIRSHLMQKHANLTMPAKSTTHAILQRYGLVTQRPAKRKHTSGSHLSSPESPNDLWCADFKGQFRLGNKRFCYPLTVSDYTSRFLLGCRALPSTAVARSKEIFSTIFEHYGVPKSLRTDNGVPFCTRGLFGLSELSLWWLRLGITVEHIAPGCPGENGRHERMHLTLKQETIQPAALDLAQQQKRFEQFIEIYNHERPHEGLAMKTPSQCYIPSKRSYPKQLPPVEYPNHDWVAEVNPSGMIAAGRGKKVSIGKVFKGLPLGIQETEEGIFRVSFMHYDLGYYDHENYQLVPAKNPFFTERGG